MADLEEHAFKRDRRFVVRLVLMLACGLVFGLFIYAQLTSERTAGCVSTRLGAEPRPSTDTALRSDPKPP